jgi:hypothetical protein
MMDAVSVSKFNEKVKVLNKIFGKSYRDRLTWSIKDLIRMLEKWMMRVSV